MTHQEAEIYCKTIKWKVERCNAGGSSCWCRIIVPIEKVFAEDEDAIRIVHAGVLSNTLAKHIVKLHNEYIDSL